MTTEDLLYVLGGTTPTEFNPNPGFSPLTRMRGPMLLAEYEPHTTSERHLVETARPLFGHSCTPEEHRKFRSALYRVYLDWDYTPEELAPYFPDQKPIQSSSGQGTPTRASS